MNANDDPRATRQLLSEEVRNLVGSAPSVVLAPDVVEAGAIRRFSQAIMDPDPLYWSQDAAANGPYREIVAPALFPLHCLRPQANDVDPLEQTRENPDYDGAGDILTRLGLPTPTLGQGRLLNGGYEVEIYELAHVGDTLEAISRVLDITEKAGRSGPLVFMRVETVFNANNRGAELLRSIQTHIFR